jgi:hypothetical protein
MVAAIPARADRVDDYLTAAIRDQHIPGLALVVVRDGQVVKAAGYGFANLELRAPITPRTVFEIGSLTKQFTAAAILLRGGGDRLHRRGPGALGQGASRDPAPVRGEPAADVGGRRRLDPVVRFQHGGDRR